MGRIQLSGMSSEGSSFLDRLRQPEYTGDNRCLPCTIGNVTIAFVASTFVALASIPVAVALFVLALAAIYFRGYLIPGTPELTKQYMPARVLAVFDKHPAADAHGGPDLEVFDRLEDERQNAVEPDQYLLDTGVIELTDDGADYRLTDTAAAAIDRHLGPVREAGTDHEALPAVFGTDRDAITPRDREYPAVKVDYRVRKWPSEAALYADLATHEALVELTDDWLDVPVDQRPRILEALRGFQRVCPNCGGEIGFSDDVVESCCGQYRVTTIDCADCGQHLREFDQARVGSEEEIEGLTP